MKQKLLLAMLLAGPILQNAWAQNTVLGTGAGGSGGSTNATHIGTNAGRVATGLNNSFLGHNSGYNTTSGYENSALGSLIMYYNTTGHSNSAFGFKSLHTNTTGYQNTSFGHSSLQYNQTGIRNTAIGMQALYVNSTGGYNTAVGVSAMSQTTSGTQNAGLGAYVMNANTTGGYNSALGANGLLELTTGSYNTSIGYNTGRGISTGSNNTIIGANVTGLSAGLSNYIILADGAGNRRLNIDNNGNVGIGTNTPGYKLDVQGTTNLNGDMNAVGLFNLQSPAGASSSVYNFMIKDNSGTPSALFGVQNNGDVTINKLGNGTTRMLYVDPAGKVYADNVISPTNSNTYTIGGNTATTYGDRDFGFTDNANIRTLVNNFEAYKVYGRAKTGSNPWYNTGFVEFRRNVAIGGSVSNPYHCDGNTVLGLQQGQFEITNGYATHQTLFTGQNINGLERFRFDASGNTEYGKDIYTVGNTTFNPGIYYDTDKELWYMNQNKDITIGYPYGRRASMTNGGIIWHGITIYNPSSNHKNFLQVGPTTIIQEDESRFTGDMTVAGDVLPDADATYNIGAPNIARWNYGYFVNQTVGTSDIRLKENINSYDYGLSDVLKMKSITFNWKNKNIDTILHYGFSAQELRKIFPKGIVLGDESKGNLGVMYGELIPVLTKAIQEQQVQIEDLKKMVLAGNTPTQNSATVSGSGTQKVEITKNAVLFQNHPNPINGITFIDYYIPTDAGNAFIKITDAAGKLVQAFPINQNGYGQIELNCTKMAPGNYFYSLLVNTKIVDTKPMTVAAGN